MVFLKLKNPLFTLNLFSLFTFTAMRIFTALCRNCRRPQDPNRVPLAKPRLPFGLRDRVCTKKQKSGSAPALQEMQNLITKLAQNNYNQQFCKNEISDMQNANTTSYMEFLREKEENRAGKIKPGNQLNPVPLNKYLKRFPIVKQNPYEEKITTELPSWKRKYE